MAVIYGTNYHDNNTYQGTPHTGGAFYRALSGTNYNDSLFGYAGQDILYGLGGNDTLYGGPGYDIMYGGAGNDVYVVEPDIISSHYPASTTDKIIEAVGEGIDTVYSQISTGYKWLPANVENLTLTSATYYGPAYSGEGNDLSNEIIGNDSRNKLSGYGGYDTLYGLGGDDLLYGGGGNDTFVGGAGADTMYGGLNHDIYYVDSIADQVIEYANEGIDTVYSSISGHDITSLSSNVENLTLTGTTYRGNGNDSNNIITGNDSTNDLYGGAGNDTLHGLNGSDGLSGAGGADTIYGGAGDDLLMGLQGNDFLYGEEGVDRLSGGDFTETDTFYGGAGGDQFHFLLARPGGVFTPDLVKDFSFTEGDSIHLSGETGLAHIGEVYDEFYEPTALDPTYYFEGSAGNEAGDQSGIYLEFESANATEGNLWYNPTSGTAGDSQLFANVELNGVDIVGGATISSLSADDFFLP